MLTILTLEGWVNFMITTIAAAMPAIPQVTPEMLDSGWGSRFRELIEGNCFPELTAVTSYKYVAQALKQICYGKNLKFASGVIHQQAISVGALEDPCYQTEMTIWTSGHVRLSPGLACGGRRSPVRT